MPLQNRVSPLGELVADPGRGTVFGNRGCLHDGNGRIVRSYAVRRWIACRLEFRGRRRCPLLQPGRYTELFFLDEATALAAGHRPCAECRHDDYRRLTTLWQRLHPGQVGADAVDAQLHGERLLAGTRRQRYHRAPVADLPDAAFVLHDSRPHLVLGDHLWPWTARGYGAPAGRPDVGEITVITPPSLVDVLRARWEPLVPLIHPSALVAR
jgi:hypothetical protein